ncbi:proline--tRNA ligase [Candidatus Micrarchaeota archaeon CG10_big_fil_rev_8_21_14_0_10_45_29]|nr:MAG: proline--tRNA ligase [Candidatus Micrarchaeota archaeon CG10_big_fil_rev_8_21_14_0_10_45_29]
MNISKEKDFSNWFNTIISDAQLCDLRYNVKGFVVFRPWAVKTMKLMYEEYEKVLEKNGHEPAIFPSLIPEKNFDIEGEHVKGFTPEVFWVESAGDSKLEERLAMRPTSETAMYQMYSLWVRGRVDLPIKIYQSCQVWRYETKATKPFFRSREFHWIEAHDAFATKEEAEAQVEQDMQMSKQVLTEKLGIPFVFFQRPQWDKFPGAVNTFAADTLMPDGKALQLPSTHLLGQNFSKAFDVAFQNEKEEKEFVWQTCYGPCISRIYGALFCIHGDERGLVLPFEFAPLQAVIVPILGKGKDGASIIKYCQSICNILQGAGIRAKVDESENTPGFKYNYWELRGVPVRIEVGGREAEGAKATILVRDGEKKDKKEVAFDELVGHIMEEGKKLSMRLKRQADEKFANSLHEAKTMHELGEKLKLGGIVRIPFVSMENDSKKYADEIKEKFAGDVRGIKYPAEKAPSGEKCVVSGKEATCWAYVAKQY